MKSIHLFENQFLPINKVYSYRSKELYWFCNDAWFFLCFNTLKNYNRNLISQRSLFILVLDHFVNICSTFINSEQLLKLYGMWIIKKKCIRK